MPSFGKFVVKLKFGKSSDCYIYVYVARPPLLSLILIPSKT
jgi:hypothetical protein